MSSSKFDRNYDSHAAFYEAEYGQQLRAVHRVGDRGVHVLEAVQTAGDWSDAPTPDLVLAWLPSTPVDFSFDLGGGRFSGQQRRGDAILIAPDAGASIQMYGSHTVRGIAAPYRELLRLAGSCSGLPADGDFGKLHGRLLRHLSLRRLFEGLWAEASEGSPHGAMYSEGLLLQIMAVLLRMRDQHCAGPARGGLAPWQVKRATEYIEDRLAEDVSLHDLSRLLNLSTFHLCRAFKQSVGEPPYRWRQQRRMERSREILSSTELPVIEVAAAVGYDDPSSFAIAFRRSFGMSPSQYRREGRI